MRMAKNNEKELEKAPKKKGKKRIIIISAIVLIIVGSRIVFSKQKNDVETATIQKGTVKEELVLSGEVKATEHALLTFSSSGKVSWVGVKEGDWVFKGQSLMKLDTLKLNADYERAKADLRSAEASVDKALDDVKDHDSDETFAQKETRTAAEVARDKAYEAVLKAQEDLKNATLVAPFSGLITDVLNPYSGVSAIYTQSQVEIVNPDTVYFEVTADQSEVSSLSIDQPVSIYLDSFPEDELSGKIIFISYTPKTDETGTVYEIKVEIDSIDTETVRVGMTGDASFVLSQEKDVLYVPLNFVNSDKKGKYINLQNKNNKEYVETGIEGEDRIEIIGNIKEGQAVFD